MWYTKHGQLADIGQKRQKEMRRREDYFLFYCRVCMEIYWSKHTL